MIAEWVLTLSMVIYISSTVISVLEEWPKQGLTDTSFLVLTLWMIGSLGIMGSGILLGWFPFTLVGMFSAIVTGYGIGLKLYDYRHIVKGLALHNLHRRRRS